MKTRTMRVPVMYRTMEIEARAIDVENRIVRDLTFSTESPVRRWFGDEILDHTPAAVDLQRLRTVGSVLLNHDPNRPVARPENVRIEDGQGRADARFGTKPLAEEAWTDVREGVIRGVSVGYVPLKMELKEKADGKPPVYRITRWMALEFSLTPVPADAKSKTGVREDDNAQAPVFREGEPVYECEVSEPDTQEEEGFPMKKCGKCGRSYEDAAAHECPEQERREERPTETVRSDVLAEERARVKVIGELAARYGLQELGRQFIENGKPLGEFKDALLEKIGAREASIDEIRQVANGNRHPQIGMTAKDKRRFSFLRLIRHLGARHLELRADATKAEAAFELECCLEQAKLLGREPQGVFLPNDVVYGDSMPGGRWVAPPLRRDVTVTTEGADLVQTTILGEAFIDLLRNKSVAIQLGTILTGLQGDIQLPRLSGGATGSWVNEGVAPTETTQTFDNVGLSPSSVSAFSDLTRKLLIQSSPGVEQIIRNDLATAIGLAIDKASIQGSGTGAEPRGITNTAGTGSVTSGGSLDWGNIVELWSDVAGANADMGTLAFLMSARIAGVAMQTEKATGYPIYCLDSTTMRMLGNFPVYVSNQVPSGLGLGCIIFGNWQDLLIGMWDALDLLVDPYSQSQAAITRVRVIHEADVALRRLGSFSTIEDIG